MNEPNRALLRAKKQQALDRIYTYHLRPWCGSVGNTFFISDTYPGLWLEHTFDAIAWAGYEPEQHDVSRSQVRLFLSRQKPDGQLPCYIWKDKIGYSQIQECVSFGRLCIEAAEQNPQDAALLADAYEGCKKWDAWLCQHRMTRKTGLIEMFCGFDTGHDNSSRLYGMKYPNNICEDAAVPPKDDDLLPVLAPDMNAVFYGDRMALAEMAERLGRPEEAADWREKAKQVKNALFEICYDKEDEFFYDVDQCGRKRKIRSISITNVLTERVVDEALGGEIFERWLHNPKEFWTPYPFPAVSAGDPTWRQNLPGNSWGYYSQGLTALRSLRWMEAYGKGAELNQLLEKWVAAWTRSETPFGQELHPLTGEPSQSSPWYSSCMLVYLYALRRLYGL